jgi:hypothetical protein
MLWRHPLAGFLVIGSHTCVVHDVGSSHAAAACSHLSCLLSSQEPRGYVLSPYVADEYLLWKHMQHIQWVVLATPSVFPSLRSGCFPHEGQRVSSSRTKLGYGKKATSAAKCGSNTYALATWSY